mmetsp:Transcript_2527/g.7108  ORF Transcript_2527/g.7108 Transcript_2527/m.7108 type:complete len:831 (-) Transcript_2527:236-2728(-)
MASGMHAAAAGQLGSFPTASIRSIPEVNLNEPVEIAVLSAERSEEASRILQERGVQSRPMARYGRMLQCHESLPSAKLRRSPSPLDDRHPIFRAAAQLVPILSVIPTLTWSALRADAIAGLTVGVMVIPQSMSYASVAGLELKYGIYAACLPAFVYALFGQSRQLAVGPVAMVSLLVEAGLSGILSEEQCPAWYAEGGGRDLGQHQREVCKDEYASMAILTAAVVGVIQILARVLRLGFLVSFLGHPVTSGFTSGAAIIIGVSQVKYLVGFEVPKSEFIYKVIWGIATKLDQTKPVTLCLGLMWLAYLLLNKKVAQRYKSLKMLGPIGPLVCCLAGILLAWLALPPDPESAWHVKVVGSVPSGFSPISVLGWRLRYVPTVLPTALSVCLIGYMESIAIGKNLAAQHGYDIDAGQELFALGVANLIGAMFSCYPVAGSFSRSAVNNATGARTQVSGLVTALLMLLTMLFLTPLFYHLPQFVLAAIVISSVIPLVAYGEAAKLYRVKSQDFVLWVVAFIGTLFLGVLMGIAIAVGLSLVIVIYESVRPQIMILWRIPGTTIYRNVKQESSGAFIPGVFIARIGSSMYFANASFIKDMLLAYVDDLSGVEVETEYLVLEMTPVVSIDSTAAHVIQDIVSDFRGRKIQIAFAMVGNRVDKTLSKARLKEFIGENWFFATVHEAVVYCLRHQQAKRRQPISDTADITLDLPDPRADRGVLVGNEVGFSNDLRHDTTTIFINLTSDMPMIMSEITAAFRQGHISVSRAMVEPLGDTDRAGAKHTYCVRNVHHEGKLHDWEIQALRKELESIIRKRVEGPPEMRPSFVQSIGVELPV